jgi:hypothetical protein
VTDLVLSTLVITCLRRAMSASDTERIRLQSDLLRGCASGCGPADPLPLAASPGVFGRERARVELISLRKASTHRARHANAGRRRQPQPSPCKFRRAGVDSAASTPGVHRRPTLTVLPRGRSGTIVMHPRTLIFCDPGSLDLRTLVRTVAQVLRGDGVTQTGHATTAVFRGSSVRVG